MKMQDIKKIRKLENRYIKQMQRHRKIYLTIEFACDDNYGEYCNNPVWLKAKKNSSAIMKRIEKLKNKIFFDIRKMDKDFENEMKDINGFDGIITQ